MKKLSKRFIISVLTLVLTVVALGTSTFAWFSLSTVSKVSNIAGNVTAGDSLQIQLSGIKASDGTEHTTQWMSNIDAGDFLTAIAGAGFEFDAVTTKDNKNFKKMGQTTTGNLHLGDTAVANEDYLEFTINFKSQKEGVVNLTELVFGGDAGAIFVPKGLPYIQVPEKAVSSLPVSTRAAYGARVSFTDGATPTPNQQVYQMGNDTAVPKLDFNDGNNPTEVLGNYVMQSTTSIEGGQWSYLTTGLGLKIYDGAAETTQLQPNSGTILTAATAISTIDGVLTTYNTKITLAQVEGAGDYLGSVDVRVWIEGWDVDTYDSILSLPLKVDLTFKKAAA